MDVQGRTTQVQHLRPLLVKGIETPATVEINLSSSIPTPPSDSELRTSSLTAPPPIEKGLGAMVKHCLWTPSVYGDESPSTTPPTVHYYGFEPPDFSWMSTSERRQLLGSLPSANTEYTPSVYSPYQDECTVIPTSTFTASQTPDDIYRLWPSWAKYSPPLAVARGASAQKRRNWNGPLDAEELRLKLNSLPIREVGRWRHEGRIIVRIDEEEKRGSGLMFAGPKDLGDFTRKEDEERVVEVKDREGPKSLGEKSVENLKSQEERSVGKKKASLVSQVKHMAAVGKVEGVVSKKIEVFMGLYKHWSRRGRVDVRRQRARNADV